MFNVESDCYLDKRVLRYVTFSIPGFPAFCRAAPSLFSPIHTALGAYLPQSGCTVWRSSGDPSVAPRFSAQSMFWQLRPDDVVSLPADRTNVEREIWWRTKKEKMDVATGRTWTSYEWSCGAWQAREHILNENWRIFVDDRLVPRHATNLHSNAQPKAVFFCAMTVMDKICGWSEEEKWVDLYLQPVCGYTPNMCCVMDRKQRRTS